MKRIALALLLALIAAPAWAAQVALTALWDANVEPDLAGYRLYMSETSGSGYGMVLEVGRVTQATFEVDMERGETLYFVMTAFDSEGRESGHSVEASYRLPFVYEGVGPAPPSGFRLNGRVLSE